MWTPGDLHAWGPRYGGLGTRLRARRAALGLTQDALSGPPARVRRSGGRLRHRNDAKAKAHRHRKKHEPTPPGRLATRLGISRIALGRLEHDIVEPTTGRLRALATALNTTPEALRDAGAASGADEPVGGGG